MAAERAEDAPADEVQLGDLVDMIAGCLAGRPELGQLYAGTRTFMLGDHSLAQQAARAQVRRVVLRNGEVIAAIRDALNLQTRHMVFVDDRPDECELVSEVYPEALVLDATNDATWRRMALWADLLAGSSEDESLAPLPFDADERHRAGRAAHLELQARSSFR